MAGPAGSVVFAMPGRISSPPSATDTAPSFEALEPMLLTERPAPLTEPGWTHELKFDGYRVLAEVAGEGARLKTRNGSDASSWFPEVTQSLAALGEDRRAPEGRHIFDGEVCVLDELGRADFDRLQQRAKRRGYKAGDDSVVYCVFDLMVHAGEDLRQFPLATRRSLLARLLRRKQPSLLVVQHFPGDGPWLYERACMLELEGIVCKRLDSAYQSGERSDAWVKIKRPGAVPAARFKYSC